MTQPSNYVVSEIKKGYCIFKCTLCGEEIKLVEEFTGDPLGDHRAECDPDDYNWDDT